MSQSQQSDILSSFYDGEADNLGYLTSFNEPTTLSSSQPTLDTFGSEFIRPSIPPPIPPSFTRVGPTRRKTFVLYDIMAHTEWVDWWLQTDYGQKRKMQWDAEHSAKIWKDFEQVAQITDGSPKVMCKRCYKILEHPQTPLQSGKGLHGTSTMIKHLKTGACKRIATEGKTEITQFMKSAVCTLYAITLNLANTSVWMIYRNNHHLRLRFPKLPGRRQFCNFLQSIAFHFI